MSTRSNLTWIAIQALPDDKKEFIATLRFANDHANSIGPFFYA